MAKKSVVLPVKVKDRVKSIPLNEIAKQDYYIYGTATIEDRAITGVDDGLKPVMRRILWSAHKLGLHSRAKHEKSAKIVGDTLGNYHPHGDSSVYDAMVFSSHLPMKLIDGDGNFGTMTDGPAAYRYTNARLSVYSDLVFFDKFYLPVMKLVDNFDSSRKEPLTLPALLPNSILNGNFGICPGVNTRTPSYSLESVIKVLKKALKTGGATPKSCLTLEFTTPYGGIVNTDTKAVKESLLEFYRTGKGKALIESVYYETSPHIIRVNCFAPIANWDKKLQTLSDIKGVTRVNDDGDENDPYMVAISVEFQKNLKGSDLQSVIDKVMSQLSSSLSYIIHSTTRVIDDKGLPQARLFPSSVPDLINRWIDHRIQLEVDACTYWSDKIKVQIADYNLLRLAVAKKDIILAALSKPYNDDQLTKYLAKALKITEEQAVRILDLKIRQLRALEDKVLVGKIAEAKTELSGYASRKKNPSDYISKHLDVLLKELSKPVKSTR